MNAKRTMLWICVALTLWCGVVAGSIEILNFRFRGHFGGRRLGAMRYWPEDPDMLLDDYARQYGRAHSLSGDAELTDEDRQAINQQVTDELAQARQHNALRSAVDNYGVFQGLLWPVLLLFSLALLRISRTWRSRAMCCLCAIVAVTCGALAVYRQYFYLD